MKQKPYFYLLYPLGLSVAQADIILTEDFSANDGGFTETSDGADPTPFVYNSGSGTWSLEGDDSGPSTSYLASPQITITGTEEIQISFDHRYSLEADWDGCGLFVSINGGAFTRVGEDAFTSNGYRDFALIGNHVLGGLQGFNGNSPGYDTPAFITSVARIAGASVNDTIQVQFVGAFDEAARGTFLPNWEINKVTVETLTDSDGDGMPNSYEDANGLDKAVNDAADDADSDLLSNLDEYLRGTDPQDPDSDDDELNDNVETNTGIFVSLNDTGTDPNNPDSDGDSLPDGVETGSSVFVSATDTGTDPNATDSDLDGINDGKEVTDGTDPNDLNDPPTAPSLLVDFNSTTQGGGPNAVGGDYKDYNAGHEVAADFDTKNFAAFGTSVSITPTWPDSTDNRVRQMIDRGGGNDANWTGTDLQLITDFLGIDTRTGNGGNGNYDGTTGNPTTMLLTLGNLPGGQYEWTSFHHDTENVHTPFLMDLSTDGGTTFERVGEFKMSSSSGGGNPPNPNLEFGPDPVSLSSTVVTEFGTDGGSDVVIRFIPLSASAVHTQIFGINGFKLAQTSASVTPFAITSVVRDTSNGNVELTWNSKADRSYTVRFFDSLDEDPQNWFEADDGVPSGGETTTYTIFGPSPERRFYIVVENPR